MNEQLPDGIKILPGNRALVLKNATCPYCHVGLTEATRTKEHVVGRRFVPKGTLNGSWNLILFACEQCNRRKGDLENDISAITQYVTAWTNGAELDDALIAEIERKSKSKSALTGKPVSESEMRSSITLRSQAGLTMKFDLVAPPQIESYRLFELARLQMVAFFYRVTYHDERRRGQVWPGVFYPITEALRANWGGVTMLAFANAVVNWEPRFRGAAADGNFLIIMRKHPEHTCWSWALEWNKQFRVIGFFGDAEVIQSLSRDMPTPEVHIAGKNEEATFGLAMDIPLNKDDDNLFFYAPVDKPSEI